MVADNPQTVLVVDDDQALLDLVSLLLNVEGYGVTTALNGQEALATIERQMPGLILLDMKMPVMDGWEFAREFRSRYDSRVPIVVITAADDARKSAEEIGAAGWLGKPFELDTFLSVVSQFVQV